MNREQRKESRRKHYLKTKDLQNEGKRLRYKTDESYRKKAIDTAKRFRLENPELKREKDKAYRQTSNGKMAKKREYEKHKENYRIYSIGYRGREDVKKRARDRNRNRNKKDTQFNIKKRLRNSLLRAINKHNDRKEITSEGYGIKWKDIIEQLKPFPQDISKYEVDHIKPLCSFDLTDSEQVKQAFAPENHQWLTPYENRCKGGTFGKLNHHGRFVAMK